MKTLTIVNIKNVLRVLRAHDNDTAWLKQKELEVREGLRKEAEKHG